MKRILLLLCLFLATGASAQYLVKEHTWTNREFHEDYFDMETSQIIQIRFGVEPMHSNDTFLCEYNFKQAQLTLPDELKDYYLRACSQTETGYYAVVEKSDRAVSYTAVLLLYDTAKQVQKKYYLSNIYGHERFISCSRVGRMYYFVIGTQLSCFNAQSGRMMWRSEGNYANTSLAVVGNYVVCGFGGTDMDDYVHLVDRTIGRDLWTAPVDKQPVDFMTVASGDTLYVSDYDAKLYRFLIKKKGVVVRGNTVRMRKGPSTSFAIHTDANGQPVYVSRGDVLDYVKTVGDWHCVNYDGQELFISAQYSELEEYDYDP